MQLCADQCVSFEQFLFKSFCLMRSYAKKVPLGGACVALKVATSHNQHHFSYLVQSSAHH